MRRINRRELPGVILMLHTGFFNEYSSSSTSSSKEKDDAQTLAVGGVTELFEGCGWRYGAWGATVRPKLTAEDLLGLFVRLWEALEHEALVPAQLRVQLLLHEFEDQTVGQATW